MGDTLVGTAVRPRKGPHESAMRRQLAAWGRSGVLTGDAHAASRRLLVSLAAAADAATRDYRAGECSALSVARVLATWQAALVEHEPDTSDGGDLWEALTA